MFNGLKKLWPQDVGCDLEEQGQHVRFLAAEVAVNAGGGIDVWPRNVNADFALGRDAWPKVARILPWGPHASSTALRTFMVCQILSYNQLCEGQVSRLVADSIHLLVLEAYQSGWAVNAISK